VLLKRGARINVGDESALFFSLRSSEHMKFLLRRGANVNYENGFGKTVLFYAIEYKDFEMVKLLLGHKADVNHCYKSKEEIKKISWEDFPFYQSYCMLTHNKRTPLMHAAQHGNAALIKLLLEHGANLNTRDQEGCNASDYARGGKKSENMLFLKSLGLKEKPR